MPGVPQPLGVPLGQSGVIDLRYLQEILASIEALEKQPRMEVHGQVVMPKLAPGENAKLAISTVDYDTAGYWDAVNLRYTPQLAGTYFVYCFILDVLAPTAANKFLEIQIKRNKARIGENLAARFIQVGVVEGGLQGGYSCQAVMNGTTDFLEVWGNLTDPAAGRQCVATMGIHRISK